MFPLLILLLIRTDYSNSQCNNLNLTNSQCELECNYYNNIQLYKNFLDATLSNNWTISRLIFNTNITAIALNETLLNYTFRWYSLSSYPYSYFGKENPDMCSFSLGTYCNINIRSQMHGCCIPTSCKNNDAITVLTNNVPCYQSFLYYLDNNAANINCAPLPRQWNVQSILFIIFVSIFVLLSIISTLYIQCIEKNTNIILRSFSIQNNWASLKRIRNPNPYGFFNGIRCIMTYHIVFYHFSTRMRPYSINATAKYGTYNNDLLWPKNLPSDNIFTNGNTYEDGTLFAILLRNLASMLVFFIMSGFFSSYSILNLLNTKWKNLPKRRVYYLLQITALYIKRWLRLAVVLIYFVVFYVTINDQLSYGYNIFSRYSTRTDACKKFGVSVIFLYNNIYRLYLFGYDNHHFSGADQCVPGAWYTQIDFQCFLYTPFIIFVYAKSGYIYGFLVCVVPIIISWILRIYFGYYYVYFDASSIAVTHTGDFDPVYHNRKWMLDGYRMPWAWFHAYYGGVFLYLLIHYMERTQKNYQLSILKFLFVQFISWGLMSTYLLLPYSNYGSIYPNASWSEYGQIWYFISGSQAFIVGFCLFVISLKYKPNINEYYSITYAFLSSNIFEILAKLSYIIYLAHRFIFFWFWDSWNHSTHYSTQQIVVYGIANAIFVTLFSLFLWMIFENPIATIINYGWKNYVIPLLNCQQNSESLFNGQHNANNEYELDKFDTSNTVSSYGATIHLTHPDK